MTWKTACAVALVGAFVTGTASAQTTTPGVPGTPGLPGTTQPGTLPGAPGPTQPRIPPGSVPPVPPEQYTGRNLVAHGTGDGDDAALPARHRVSAMHPGKKQPVAVEHGTARHQHAADPAWRLYAEVAARARRSRRGVGLYVRSTLSFRRSSTGHQHLEARQRGRRFKRGLAQMMRENFVLLGAYRASQ
jgi:hypothetical protein